MTITKLSAAVALAAMTVTAACGTSPSPEGAAPSTAPAAQPPTVSTTDSMCGGRFVITVGGKRYLMWTGNGGTVTGQTKLIDVDANHRDEPCPQGAPDASHTAQRFTAWDRDTQGCVKTTVIDGREWIISSGWGLIPANGRVPGSDAYREEASERDQGLCRAQIRWDEKNSDGTIPATPPVIVPPVEDTAGYLIDSRITCPSQDSQWERYRYVPTLKTCVPFSTDGTGFKVRGDAADDTTPR